MKPLSERAIHLLLVVDNKTTYDKTGKRTGFYVPMYNDEYINANKYDETGKLPDGGIIDISVHGSSDAAIFRSLEKRGLIARPATSLTQKYVYVITDSGKLEIENYRRSI